MSEAEEIIGQATITVYANRSVLVKGSPAICAAALRDYPSLFRMVVSEYRTNLEPIALQLETSPQQNREIERL